MIKKHSVCNLCLIAITVGGVGVSVGALAGFAEAAMVTEDFSVDPGWTGSNNTGFGNNNYGFSNSNNAGGVAGEAGGAIASRTQEITYYADTNIGVLNQQESLTATGLLTAAGSLAGFDGGIEFGWFNSSPPLVPSVGVAVGAIFDAVAMRIIDRTATSYRIQARVGDEGGFLVNLDTDIDYLFNMNYDPNGGGLGMGRLTLEFRRASDNVLVGTTIANRSSLATPFNLNGFGFTTLDFDSDRLEGNFFVDDLTYSVAVPEPTGLFLAVIALVGSAAPCCRQRRTSCKRSSG
jgi:hypothetical protein